MKRALTDSLAMIGEFGLISRISAGVNDGVGVITGIGDDASVTSLLPGMQLLSSTDMLLEDVHFRCSWHDPFQLGKKSLAVSISDIAAMGGIPRWALLSLALPPDTPLDFLDEFMHGFLSMASEYEVTLIGGDTCSSKTGIAISVTIMGEQYPEKIVRRSTAIPDDDIWVTGTLGDAALGLMLIEEKIYYSVCSELEKKLISRLLNPVPRVFASLSLAENGLATAMIDISDGILADFGHIARLSSVGGCIYLDALPISTEFASNMPATVRDPYHLALVGGEDYELCFTAKQCNRGKIEECMKKSGIEATRIGIVTSSTAVTVLDRDGTLYIPNCKGFNHFK